MLLRNLGDGHVMTVTSIEDHVIRLFVQNGLAAMTLSVEGTNEEVIGGLLEEGQFTPVV